MDTRVNRPMQGTDWMSRARFSHPPRTSSKGEGLKTEDAWQSGRGGAVVVKGADLLKLLTGVDLTDLNPPTGPVADAFEGLSKVGYTVSDTQVRHAIRNFKHSREALVVCEDKTESVYSFRDVGEIDTFRRAVSDASSLPQDKRKLFSDLQALEATGGKIAFTRRNELLPTDAAGATVVMGRGEPLVLFDRYGVPTTVKNARQVAQHTTPPAVEANKEDVVKAMQSLEKLGFAVEPDFELPEDVEVTDFAAMIKHQLGEMVSTDPNHQPINQRKFAVEQLAGNGLASVSPPAPTGAQALQAFIGGVDEAADPGPFELPAPRALNRSQLVELAQIQSGQVTAPQKQFFGDMQKIRTDETKAPSVFSRETSSMDRGALHQANDLVAYLNLVDGGSIVLLDKDGALTHLDDLQQVHEYATTGQVTRPHAPAADPAASKTNLLMLYYDSPFDPQQAGGIYEDTPLRASQVGSGPDVDLVTLRSDLPHKKNVRQEYLQPEDMQLLKSLDPEKTMMNDPKTLENFVYDSLKAHPNDKHIRLMVAGHGGAELGLLPDGDHNDASASGAMSVDDFAGAIHNGLARFNEETAQTRKIDNLIVGSCLMGNTSFIHALARKGDVEVLSASPETLMGDDPSVVFSYLADPKTADKSAQDFACDMVDILEGSAAFPGGKKNMQFADTYGAYDLSQSKAQVMKDSLEGLFKSVLNEPQYASYVKEDIQQCPTYGLNRFINLLFGIEQRDVIQVAERIKGDARIKSDAIKKACQEVIEATSEVVLKQKMGPNYADRRGPTLYLPTESFDIDDRLMQTDLLKSTSFEGFIKLVAQQPARRTLLESLTYEVDKIMRKSRKSANEEGASAVDRSLLAALGDPADAKAEALRPLEKTRYPWLSQVYRYGIAMPVVVATTAVGAVAGAAVGAGVMGLLGTALGMHAGFTGRSVGQNLLPDKTGNNDSGGKPPAAIAFASKSHVRSVLDDPDGSGDGQPPSLDGSGLDDILRNNKRPVIRIATQVAFLPMEAGGEFVNRHMSYKHGNLVGAVSGTVAGTLTGAVGGVLTGAVLGAAVGGFIGNFISSRVLGLSH